MNIYYIDYENVSSQGLKGVEALTENDEVNLLYSKKADNVKIDMLTMLMASKAKINFLPVHVGTPNALDFQLVTLLFLKYKEGDHCYIISKDSGYDCCIKTAAENGAPNVARFPNIESAIKKVPAKRTRSRRRATSEASNETMITSVKETAKSPARQANQNTSGTAVQSSENNSNANEPSQAAEQSKASEQTQSAANAKTAGQSQTAAHVKASEQTQSATHAKAADQSQTAAHVKASEQSLSAAHAKAADQSQTAAHAKNAEQPQPSKHVNSAEAAPSTERSTAAETEKNEDAGHTAVDENTKKRPSRRRGRKKAAAPEAENNENALNTQDQPKESSAEAKNPQESGHSIPGEHVLQQRYLSKQFEPKNAPADKAKAEADKPVSILSVIRRRNDVQLDMHQVDLIRNALQNASNKQQFYSYFVKQLGQKQGIELYHSVKSSYTDLVNANLI